MVQRSPGRKSPQLPCKHNALQNAVIDDNPNSRAFPEEDFYWEGAYMVFTAAYLLRRGYCCRSGCRHCPYGFGPEGLKNETLKNEALKKQGEENSR